MPDHFPILTVDINEEKRPFNEAVEEAEEKLREVIPTEAEVRVWIRAANDRKIKGPMGCEGSGD